MPRSRHVLLCALALVSLTQGGCASVLCPDDVALTTSRTLSDEASDSTSIGAQLRWRLRPVPVAPAAISTREVAP